MALDADTVLRALQRIGERLPPDRGIELVIAGGGAALLSGLLPAGWVTSDVDAIDFRPVEVADEVLTIAGEVRHELGLPPDWLNAHSQLFYHTLPDGWQERRQLIATFGPLRVYAISRVDFIAMKFQAHRQTDIEHLEQLRPQVSRSELEFLSRHLDSQAGTPGADQGRIDRTRMLITEWRARDAGTDG